MDETLPPLETTGDADLFLVAVLFWIASVARVIAGVVEGEAFFGEATLASGCVVLVPWWLFRAWHERQSPHKRGQSGAIGASLRNLDVPKPSLEEHDASGVHAKPESL